PVTVVNGGKGGTTYGNDVLEVGLWPQDFVFKPGGPGFVDSDGALGMKVMWNRKKRGHLEVGGRRLDGEAKPVRAYFGDAGEIGGQPTYLVFPTPGCWQVTGYVGDGSLTLVLSVVILPPTRALLRRLCPLEDTVAFWTRFTVLMLFLGPLLVTLIFGVPYSELSSKLTATDLIVRVISATLVGSFLTLGGIGLRIGTLRQPVGGSLPPPKRTDDERIR